MKAMKIVTEAKNNSNVINLNSFSFIFYFSNWVICKRIYYIWQNKI